MDVSFLFLVFYAVAHHGHAEGAAHRDDGALQAVLAGGGALGFDAAQVVEGCGLAAEGSQGFFSSLDVDVLFAGLRLFPHLGAAGAAAEAVGLAALHFH